MQTFLPYADFQKSAKVLDYRRLNKQGVEAYQILRSLLGESTGWTNHPAVKMWRGYEDALLEYALIMRNEWIGRNYRDSLLTKLMELMIKYNLNISSPKYPKFLGNEEFHRSHRSNLTRKLPAHYSQFWDEPDNLPYIWEIHEQI
jgi:hypothetical protein